MNISSLILWAIAALSTFIGLFYLEGWKIILRFPKPRRFNLTLPYVPAGQAESLLLENVPFDQAYEKILSRIINPLENKENSLSLYNKSNPDIFLMYLFRKPILFVSNIDYIRQIAYHPEDFPKVGGTNAVMQMILGESVIMTEGEVWKKHHNALKSCLRASFDAKIIFGTLESLRSNWGVFLNSSFGKIVQFDSIIKRFVFQVMGLYSYGYDYNMLEKEHAAYLDFLSIMDRLVTTPFWIRLINMRENKYIPFFKETRVVLDRVYKHFDEILAAKRKNPIGESSDVLSLILKKLDTAVQHDSREPIYSDKDIKDDMMSLFFAGHETTGSAICIVFHYLAIFRPRQQELRETILDFLSIKLTRQDDIKNALRDFLCTSSTATIQDKLPELSAFILEATRLTPPVAMSLFRQVNNDGIKLGDYVIPKDILIEMDIYSANRSPLFNGPGKGFPTNEFHPERFFDNTTSELTLNRKMINNMMNFMIGPHTCLGNTFATLQIHMATIYLLFYYEFSLPDNSPHKDRLQTRPRNSIFSPVDLKMVVNLREY